MDANSQKRSFMGVRELGRKVFDVFAVEGHSLDERLRDGLVKRIRVGLRVQTKTSDNNKHQ